MTLKEAAFILAATLCLALWGASHATEAQCGGGCKASRCYDYGRDGSTCGRNCYCYQLPDSTEGVCVEP